MSEKIDAYRRDMEGRWFLQGVIFDFAGKTDLASGSTTLEIKVRDDLEESAGRWQGYLSENEDQIVITYSSVDFKNRRAKITKLRNGEMIWEGQDETGNETLLLFTKSR